MNHRHSAIKAKITCSDWPEIARLRVNESGTCAFIAKVFDLSATRVSQVLDRMRRIAEYEFTVNDVNPFGASQTRKLMDLFTDHPEYLAACRQVCIGFWHSHDFTVIEALESRFRRVDEEFAKYRRLRNERDQGRLMNSMKQVIKETRGLITTLSKTLVEFEKVIQ